MSRSQSSRLNPGRCSATKRVSRSMLWDAGVTAPEYQRLTSDLSTPSAAARRPRLTEMAFRTSCSFDENVASLIGHDGHIRALRATGCISRRIGESAATPHRRSASPPKAPPVRGWNPLDEEEIDGFVENPAGVERSGRGDAVR